MKNIIKNINETDHNFVFSPIVVYHALGLLAKTVNGDSKKEILDALNLKDEELDEKIQLLNKNFNINASSNDKLMLNSSLWVNKRVQTNDDKLKELKEAFNFDINKVNMGTFSADQKIQRWVNKNTGGFLKDSASNIKTDKDSLFELFSATYLKGRWVLEFNKKKTKKDIFHKTEKEDIKCDFMNNCMDDNLYIGKRFKAIALNFYDVGAMIFILPNEGLAPSDIANDEDVLAILNGDTSDIVTNYYKINYSIPKFDITNNDDIKDKIRKLGIKKVFNMDEADFTPISSEKDVFLNKTNQSSRIKIDEEGVEAASFVELSALIGSIDLEMLEEIDFILNRPFMFSVIKDKAPLFVGTITNPLLIR